MQTSHFRAYPTAADLHLRAPEPLWLRVTSRIIEGILVAVTLVMLALVLMPSTAHAQSTQRLQAASNLVISQLQSPHKKRSPAEIREIMTKDLEYHYSVLNECSSTGTCTSKRVQFFEEGVTHLKTILDAISKLEARYTEVSALYDQCVAQGNACPYTRAVLLRSERNGLAEAIRSML